MLCLMRGRKDKDAGEEGKARTAVGRSANASLLILTRKAVAKCEHSSSTLAINALAISASCV